MLGEQGLMAETQKLRDQWALRGAVARLNEISDEMRAILRAFPELRTSVKELRDLPGIGSPGQKKRRTLSPEARKRMSEGMRKFWAKRKASGKGKNKAPNV